MGIKVNTGLVAEWWELPGQKDDEEKARFKLKPLNQIDYYEAISNSVVLEDGTLIPNRMGLLTALKRGLVDWEGVADQNDRPLKFSSVNFQHIPAPVLSRIFGELLDRSDVDVKQEKN